MKLNKFNSVQWSPKDLASGMKTGFCSASFQLASIKSVALVFEQEVNLKLFSIECRKKGVIIPS